MSDFGGAIKQAKAYDIALIGVPFDGKSTFLRGPAEGPQAIRVASTSAAINPYTELGVDLSTDSIWIDKGDIDVSGNFSEISARLETSVQEVLQHDAVPVILGGDHSITYPIVKALARNYSPLDILHFDAHPDLYMEYNGDPFSHACPFARIIEEDLVANLIQVGIRAATPEHKTMAAEHNIRMLEMKDLQTGLDLHFSHPLYISFDVDALDPAFAPGVSHCEPGGLSTRQVIQMIHSLQAQIIGMDVVEVNPHKDVSGITASAAVKIIMEVMGKMVMLNSNQEEGK